MKNRLRSDLNAARRARDKVGTLVLSTVLAEVRNAEIAGGGELDDKGVLAVLAKAIKQRTDAAEQMKAGGRPELAEKEEAQSQILRRYLPPELSPAEVRNLTNQIVGEGATTIGEVMSRLMPRIAGRFDGKMASQIVREELRAREEAS